MSYNGSGTFTINSTGQPVVAGTVITASAFNALTTDLATGLTTAITKDGQTTTTARITFAQGITSSLVTDSSSVSTGSIITDGGVGIAKNLYVGGTLNVTGSTSLTNPVINNIKMGYTTTATAAGTTTLTVSSNYRQFFTGSTTQTIVLPVTSTLVSGMAYEIENNSTGTLTVNSSGGNLVGTVPAGVCAHAVCIGTTLTTAADWDWDYISTTTITGTGANVLGTSPTIATPTITGDATISGLTVGKGGGAVSTNTAVGYQAINASATGINNVAVGYQAAYTNSTGAYGVFLGRQAGYSNTTGSENTATGNAALYSNSTGTQISAYGSNALYNNTTGSNNTALGNYALNLNTTASNNTAVGYQAGYTNTTGVRQVHIGYQAGYLATGSYNVLVGGLTGSAITTGTANTFIGDAAGVSVTTGSKNAILGAYTGNNGGLDIRTSSNYIVLSDGDGNPRGVFGSDGELYVGIVGKLGGSANAWIQAKGGGTKAAMSLSIGSNGDNAVNWYNASNAYVGSIVINSSTIVYGGTSDYRLKQNVAPMSGALDKVSALKPVTYKWKVDGTDGEGFIAHELQEVCPSAVVGEKDAINEDGSIKPQQIDTSFLVATLTAAIQELKTIVDAQASEITALKAKVGI